MSTPVAGFQSRTDVSREPDASSRPSVEKATDSTEFKWPSSVCSSGPHLSWTRDTWHIEVGISCLNCARIIAV
ncbi:hypothetical protein ASPFODRAFT_555149 [Aspergillus luchuensis CBS 106.47]|uniref:Uncharacterized protein n=1 Tax=Aspergillus luchuensis (strain CBS 106.47) TaxID=1137211 RepID=A0A1M3SZ05_ASPLC|nr:hypothetical protein ASPFODRAFT_555149 [Aspergillus luchuensis CBS 106.47]